jgi:2Fe-2S ferredoxin
MPKVRFMPLNVEVDIPVGTPILDAALENDIHIDHNCGGNCACSTCHVIIQEGYEGLEEPSEDEIDMLEDAEELTKTSRLACQTEITGDLVVLIPESH